MDWNRVGSCYKGNSLKLRMHRLLFLNIKLKYSVISNILFTFFFGSRVVQVSCLLDSTSLVSSWLNNCVLCPCWLAGTQHHPLSERSCVQYVSGQGWELLNTKILVSLDQTNLINVMNKLGLSSAKLRKSFAEQNYDQAFLSSA